MKKFHIIFVTERLVFFFSQYLFVLKESDTAIILLRCHNNNSLQCCPFTGSRETK